MSWSPYTPDEIAHIESRYPVASCRTIAAELLAVSGIERSEFGVYQKAQLLGLRRTAEQRAAMHRAWWKQRKKA